jgi:hypothetical protein
MVGSRNHRYRHSVGDEVGTESDWQSGTDCSFTSYSQCLATASGLGAECYGKTFRDDDADGFPATQHPNSHGY